MKKSLIKKIEDKENDIKLTPKNLKLVFDFILGHLEDNGEYDEESGVIGSVSNAIEHIRESDNIILD
jgi:hypothetical protein